MKDIYGILCFLGGMTFLPMVYGSSHVIDEKLWLCSLNEQRKRSTLLKEEAIAWQVLLAGHRMNVQSDFIIHREHEAWRFIMLCRRHDLTSKAMSHRIPDIMVPISNTEVIKGLEQYQKMLIQNSCSNSPLPPKNENS